MNTIRNTLNEDMARLKALEKKLADEKNALIKAKTEKEMAEKNIETYRAELAELGIEDTSNEGITKIKAELQAEIKSLSEQIHTELEKLS